MKVLRKGRNTDIRIKSIMKKETTTIGDQAKERFAFLVLNEPRRYFKGRQGPVSF